MPCCLGYTASNILTSLERKAGLEPALSFLACPERLSNAKLPNGLATFASWPLDDFRLGASGES